MRSQQKGRAACVNFADAALTTEKKVEKEIGTTHKKPDHVIQNNCGQTKPSRARIVMIANKKKWSTPGTRQA